ALEERFARWVAAFRDSAHAAGIDAATLDVAFAGVRLVPRALELDRAQPEFTRAVWDYLDRAVSPQRVALGQQKLAEVRTGADATAAVELPRQRGRCRRRRPARHLGQHGRRAGLHRQPAGARRLACRRALGGRGAAAGWLRCRPR